MNRLFQAIVRRPFVFFLIPFLIYMLNFREISNRGDTVPTVFTALSLLWDGDIFLGEIRDYVPYERLPYFLSERRGHLLSNYPILPGILSAPVFLPGVLFDWIRPDLPDACWRFFSKCAGSLYTALSVLMLFLTLRRLTTSAGAMVLSMAYAFGTASWPISSQALWQHGPSGFLWMVSLYALVRVSASPPRLGETQRGLNGLLFLAGFAAGLAVGCRLINLAAFAVVAVGVLFQWKGRGIVYFLAGLLPPVLLLVAYNFYYFGTWDGGLSQVLELRESLDGETGGVWDTPLLVGITGNLVSPSRGLFVFSPFLLFSVAGIAELWKNRETRVSLLGISMWAPLVLLLIFSKYTVWWGGNAHYGPRYQIEMLPVLMLLLGVGWKRFSAKRWLLVVFCVLLACSIFIQWVGAYCHPSEWAMDPVPIFEDKSRLWDWCDNQVVRCLQSGVKPRVF